MATPEEDTSVLVATSLVVLILIVLVAVSASQSHYDYSSPNQLGHEHEFMGRGLLK